MSTLDRDPDDPAHAPVRAALAETGADLQPKPGWEAKVWERIDAGTSGATNRSGMGGGTSRNRRAVWLVGGGVLAAAAVALVVWRGGGGGRERVAVADASLEIRRSSQVVRGTSAAPGDTAVVHYPARGAAVWIYRGESMLFVACDATAVAPPVCERDGDGVVVELELARPGTYHVLTFVRARRSDVVAPETLDDALAALTTAGVRFRHDELEVR